MSELPRGVTPELLVELAARVDEMDDAGRLPADLAATMAEAGLFRQLVPAAVGGGEGHPADLVRSVETIARVNPSAAWCVMIAATSGAMAGWLPTSGAEEVFGDPLGVWGGAYAPIGRATREGGAWRLSGRWPWGSGSQNCTWMAGGAVCDDGGVRLLWVPASDITIHENWDVVGLRGTGSHDWSVDDVLVPVDHGVDLFGGAPVATGPLYQFPLFGLLALGICSVALGVAATALDEFAELAGAKTPSLQRRTLAQRGTVQAEVARAAASLRAAHSYVFASVDAAWADATAGHPPTMERRADVRLAATNAAHVGLDVVNTVFTLAGGTAARNDAPFGRLLRDARVVTQHLMVSPVTYEPIGRVLLGLPVDLAEL